MTKQEKLDRTWALDLETTPKSQYEKEGYTRSWLTYISNRSRTLTHLDIKTEGMLDYLINNAPDGLNIVYSHNGGHFDMEFFGDWLSQFKYFDSSEGDRITLDDVNMFSAIITPGKIMEITLVLEKKVFKFRDSKLMFSAMSISDMEGALIGENKHRKTSIDYSKEHYETSIFDIPKNEIDYMINDVEVMLKYFSKMEEELNKVLPYKNRFSMYDCKMTASSETLHRFKNHFAEVYKKEHSKKMSKNFILQNHFECDKELWDKISTSYNGGMTYVNPNVREKIIDKVIQYDVNSMYPGVMMNEELPYGPPIEINETSLKEKDKYFKFYKIEILLPISIKEGYHPWIPFKNEDNIAEHLPYIDTTVANFIFLAEPSYKDFLNDYTGVEGVNIISTITHMFHKKIMFKDYMEDWEIIKAKGGFYKTFAKLMMNGLYGKWAQKRKMEGRKLIPFKEINLTMSKADFNNKARLGHFVLDKSMTETEKPLYIPIASAITSYARSNLTRAIQNNKERFLYCDTDSVHLQGHEPAKGIEIHDSKFGAWGVEWKAERAIYVRAKRYMVELDENNNKIVLAGFNQYRPKNLEEFQKDCVEGITINEATQGRRKVKGGVIILMKKKTLKGNSINELNVSNEIEFDNV